MGWRFLYLVRHGEYKPLEGLTEPDGPLTDMGRHQAHWAAQELKSLPVSLIHHSTAIRATETAEIISEAFPGVPLCPSDWLRECIPSVPSLYLDVLEDIPEEMVVWGAKQCQYAVQHYLHCPPPEGNQHEIIVAHGNLLSHFVCHVLNAPIDSWLNTDLHYCGISRIVIDSQGRIRLRSHNEIGHLPVYLR